MVHCPLFFFHRLWRNKLRGSFYRKECYWTLCTVTFAKTRTKEAIPVCQLWARAFATHFYRNNLRSGFPSPLFIWEATSNFFPFISPTKYALSSIAKRIPHGRLQPEASPMPWRHQICIAKCQFSYRGDLPQNLAKLRPKNKTSSSGWCASLKITSVG